MSRRNRPRLSLPQPAAPAPPPASRAPDHAAALDEAIRFFCARDPEGWDALALCPLQHGIETILRELRTAR